VNELRALVDFVKSRRETGPLKLHHGVRSIKAGRYGFTAEAEAWIFGDDATTVKQTSTAPCQHSYSAELGGCVWCGVYGADGKIIAHKKERTIESTVYRFPYKAALSKIARFPVPQGYPRMHDTIAIVLDAGASWPAALVERYPAIESQTEALRHAAVCLRKFRAVYSEAPPQHWPR